MTQIDGRPVGDAEHMPVRWYSIQWWSIRTLWALFTLGLTVHGKPADTGAFLFGVALGVIVFGVLTAIAYRDRRIWAREHADD